MKKKTIITAFVCLIIALSSFVMFACGGDGKTSYQYYTTFFNTIKTEGAMFESGSAVGVQTNYQLKNFQIFYFFLYQFYYIIFLKKA